MQLCNAVIHKPQQLQDAFGAPEFKRLLQRMYQSLEKKPRAKRYPATGTVFLKTPTSLEREAIEKLFGKLNTKGGLRVGLRDLEQRLQKAGICDSLADAIEHLVGPIGDRKVEAALKKNAWQQLYDHVSEQIQEHPVQIVWWNAIRQEGLLRRWSQSDPNLATHILHKALHVIKQLPTDGIFLPELAANTLGDSHGLDAGRPIGTLVWRYAELLNDQEPANHTNKRTSAKHRRDVWAHVGVLCDELSSTVLVLNLHVPGIQQPGLLDKTLALHTAAGEPVRLTLGQLVRHPPDLSPLREQPVYICENVTVLAASAHQLRSESLPLICTDGEPSTTVMWLLDKLSQVGAQLHYHGDFDWRGLSIAQRVMKRCHAQPWRMGHADYQRAEAQSMMKDRPTLRGPEVCAPWDPKLTDIMRLKNAAIHEEQVIPSLLKDLKRVTCPR